MRNLFLFSQKERCKINNSSAPLSPYYLEVFLSFRMHPENVTASEIFFYFLLFLALSSPKLISSAIQLFLKDFLSAFLSVILLSENLFVLAVFFNALTQKNITIFDNDKALGRLGTFPCAYFSWLIWLQLECSEDKLSSLRVSLKYSLVNIKWLTERRHLL